MSRLSSLAEVLDARLKGLEQQGLYRRPPSLAGAQEPVVRVEGREVLLLCSNNYLGLATHPALKKAAQEAIALWGCGAGASRLISGTLELHRELEGRLAAFKHTEAALIFPSGYHANLGVLPALVGPQDTILSDELNHASIIDGCRLSRARVQVFRHRDVDHLSELLSALPPSAAGLL